MISRRYETLFTAATLVGVAAVIGGAAALFAFAKSPPVPAAEGPPVVSPEPLLAQAAPAAAGKKRYDAPPKMAIDPSKDYSAVLTTNMGTITAKLFAKDAPKTVNNFVFLAKEGFYDGTIFHRIIDDFMIQGGDPQGTGQGGPGYEFANETKPSLTHEAFTMSMANAGPDTNGSQFFITEKAQHRLDGSYSVFGRVTQGQDVVEKIESVKTDARDRPLKDVVLESVKIKVDGQDTPATKPAE